eukprot:TRINITY_DN74332_c0_g1_i1.p1 TRINITY_DN74332_c0_g1~~TRINITY_DN74332_c0_g1_i1.p1  ORF type:complete len:163 (-),score=19.92 TRINITY_DN74332_c0_g1_i1:113-601(-)
MSFGKSARDQYHLTGSDNPRAPDYVKPHPAKTNRDAERKARADSCGPGRFRDALPRLPLKVVKPKYRSNTIARESQRSEIDLSMASRVGFDVDPMHPLRQFSKPAALKFSGRQRIDDGELAKITSIPYNAAESALERRVATRGAQACRSVNDGLGRQLFGVA